MNNTPLRERAREKIQEYRNGSGQCTFDEPKEVEELLDVIEALTTEAQEEFKARCLEALPEEATEFESTQFSSPYKQGVSYNAAIRKAREAITNLPIK